MARWRRCIQHYPAIGLLLVVTLVVQLLFQLRFHLHHDPNPQSQGHEHVIDFHVLVDDHETDHNGQENVHELKSAPDAIVKKFLGGDTGFLFSVCLLLLFPVVIIAINRQWSLPRNSVIHSLYYGLAPPLRAPPAL